MKLSVLCEPCGQKSLSKNPSRAELKIRGTDGFPFRVSRYVTGKFCVHLGSNIYNGMCAQILRNPTFGSYPFNSEVWWPDGGNRFEYDPARIRDHIRRLTGRQGLTVSVIEKAIQEYSDGLAFWWCREGSPGSVPVSPDTGPYGERAQRVEVSSPKEGIAQWIYLPLHRARSFELDLTVRSPDLSTLKLALYSGDAAKPFF
ncbi:hypothetical protein ES703_120768 [subsurface metagenome]